MPYVLKLEGEWGYVVEQNFYLTAGELSQSKTFKPLTFDSVGEAQAWCDDHYRFLPSDVTVIEVLHNNFAV